MFVGPLLALLTFGCIILRWALRKLERRVNLPTWLHYYTWLYLMFFIIYLMVLLSVYRNVLANTDWLEPASTRKFVATTIREESEPIGDIEKWNAEASLDDYPRLRVFSLLSPLWIFAAFLICGWSTYNHVMIIEKAKAVHQVKGLVDMKLHDYTILILQLPMIYGLVSFAAVHRMWEICINHSGTETYEKKDLFRNFEERRSVLNLMYDADLGVGNAFEAYALMYLGKIILDILDREREAKEKECNKLILEEANRVHIKKSLATDPCFQQLEDTLRRVTLSGLRLFILTCLTQALYVTITAEMCYHRLLPKFFNPNPSKPGIFQTQHAKVAAFCFFSGAGFVSSAAAIGNIMEVEDDFEDLLYEFQPSLKFWATKILVSLAFLQSILFKIIPPFNIWTQTRTQLLYSSALCFECFVLAALHQLAWTPDAKWYHNEDGELELRELSNARHDRRIARRAGVESITEPVFGRTKSHFAPRWDEGRSSISFSASIDVG